MAWLVLIVSGLLEVTWASALSASENFSKPVPTVIFLVTMILSLVGLSWAMQDIPIGTAYGVWVGIGAVGAAIYGIVGEGDPATPARIGFLALLVIAIIGLRASSAA